ncbi:MAG: glycosyltransferase [Chitinophagaceae bacterium]
MIPATRIKVLETIRQGLIGGGESHVLSLVQNLEKSVFEPIVLSFTEGQMINSLNSLGIKNVVIPTTKAFDVSVWSKVKKLMIRENIQLVHAHGTRANTNVFWAAASLGIPLIYTVHGWSFHDDQHVLVKRLRIWSELYLTRQMRFNISVSETNQRTGKKHFGKFESIVVNNGIDLDRFSPSNVSTDVRSELGISSSQLLIGFVGRMTWQKQPLALIRAFKKLLEQVQHVKLLFVGEGELRSEAEKLAESLNVSEHILFENFRLDMPEVLNALDIYCLPSLWEGLPIGLLEAMSMGKAVIATAVDGSTEIITHNENGLLIQPGDTDQLASALLRLCSDRNCRLKLGTHAIATIQSRYNVIAMTRQIEEVYKKALDGHENLNRKKNEYYN